MRHRAHYLALVVVLALGGCGGGAADEPEVPAAVDLACTHAANVYDDSKAGVLTDAETRVKWREVADRADGTAVQGEADRLLAAATSIVNGDLSASGEYSEALEGLAVECAEIVTGGEFES